MRGNLLQDRGFGARNGVKRAGDQKKKKKSHQENLGANG